MIGIVIATHGSLSEALLEASKMIIGDVPQVASVSLMPGDSLEGLVDRLRSAVQEVEAGSGVLILLDMLGGTPANAAGLLTRQIDSVQAVSGVSLAMLLETLMARISEGDVKTLAETATSAGHKGILNIGDALDKHRKDGQS